MHEVLHGFGYFVEFWKRYEDLEFGQQILNRLESRWREWEQPLLLLSWLLHPNYQMKKFKSNVANLNHVYLSKWLIYYYEAWSHNKSRSILREYENFRRGAFPFDDQSINHFKDGVFEFWSWATPTAKELAFVAQRIFGICINAASVERLWSCMGFLHTNRRCQLHVSIV